MMPMALTVHVTSVLLACQMMNTTRTITCTKLASSENNNWIIGQQIVEQLTKKNLQMYCVRKSTDDRQVHLQNCTQS